MAQIAVEMTGDEAKLWRSMQKMVDQQKKMEGGLDRVARKSKRAGKEVKGAFDPKLLTRFTGALTGAGGVALALKVVTAELGQIIELQQKAATEQRELSSTHKDVIRNLPGASEQKVARVLQSVETIARTSKVDERFIGAAMAEALSASGGNVEASRAAVEQAAKFLADRPAMIGAYTGSLLDLSKVTGTTDAKINQGLLTLVGGLSRVVSPASQAQNIPRSLIGQIGFGATAPGAAALFAALTTGSADIKGATSGTAAIGLAEQLEEFLPGMENMSARISRLQQEPELARTFLEGGEVAGREEKWAKASFEKVALGPVRQLLTDATSDVARQFAANLASFPDLAGLAEVAEKTISNFLVDPLESGAQLRRTWKSAEQQLLKANLIDAQGNLNREGLQNVLKATGESWLGTTAAKWQLDISTHMGRKQSFEKAIGLLEGRVETLEAPGQWEIGGPVGLPTYVPHGPGQDEQVEILRELLNSLKLLLEATERHGDRNRRPALGATDEDR